MPTLPSLRTHRLSLQALGRIRRGRPTRLTLSRSPSRSLLLLPALRGEKGGMRGLALHFSRGSLSGLTQSDIRARHRVD